MKPKDLVSYLHQMGGADVFVHVSGLISEIREHDNVSYDVQNGQKGLNAVNVSVI
jgi:CspA family cold shock protein